MTDQKAIIAINASYPDYIIEGHLAKDSGPISLPELLAHFVPGIPAPEDSLLIDSLALTVDPGSGRYAVDAAIKDTWALDIGGFTLSLESLALALVYERSDVELAITGEVSLLGALFVLAAEHPHGGAWTFSGGLAEGEEIDLARLISEFLGAITGQTVALPDELSAVSLTTLEMGLTPAERAYRFAGATAWQIDAGGVGITIDAGIEIEGDKQLYTGTVGGAVSFDGLDADFLRNLRISAAYTFNSADSDSALIFSLATTTFAITGTLTEANNEHILTLSFGTSTTFGDVLSFFAQLIDPNIVDLRLESPWDMLNSLGLGAISAEMNLTTQEIGFSYAANLDYDFISLDTIGLRYRRERGTPRTMVIVTGSFLGQSFDDDDPLTWDALDDSPPNVPGQGKAAFDLEYLGLGQRIALRDAGQYTSIDAVTDALIDAVLADAGSALLPDGESAGGPLVFSKDSGWLFGAKFTLLEMLDMSLIFNDPVLYGLLIELSGAKAKQFAGLRFEILYRRISDTIGVYQTELTLPDAMRQMQFGAVAITLPVVALDIYTNGDFRIDVGFPANGDFSRSAVVEVGIFIGAGGFYFAKLSGATATGIVPAITNGVFTPVLAFGLGLKVGLGRTFNKGPLKAELSVTVQGIFEGVLAWFKPNEPTVPEDTYFWLQATVQIVGRVYGEVDFEVISVSVEVVAYASVQLTIEAYMPIEIILEAGVSVRASVKILFVKVHFSFDMTIREDFTIGEPEPTPWQVAPGGQPVRAAGMGIRPMGALPPSGGPVGDVQARSSITTFLHITPIAWQPRLVWAEKQPLTLYVQPSFTEGLAADDPAASGGNDAQVKGVVLLFVPNGISDDRDYSDSAPDAEGKSFNLLAQAALAWAVLSHRADSTPPPSRSNGGRFADSVRGLRVTPDALRALHRALVEGDADDAMPFTLDNLLGFLGANFDVTITDYTLEREGGQVANVTIFPMFPQLQMTVTDGQTIDFSGGDADTPAESIFMDYFTILLRAAADAAVDHMADSGLEWMTLDALLDDLRDSGRFNHIAGMLSRFLLHGLRLPLPDARSDDDFPLYALTGQQFTVPEPLPDPFSIVLEERPGAAIPWLAFTDYDYDVDPPTASQDAGRIAYRLKPEERDFIAALGTLTFTPQIDRADVLPYFQLHPLRFTLAQGAPWQDPTTAHSLWMMPDGLRRELEGVEVGDALPLRLYDGDGEAIPDSAYKFATRVTFRVRRVPRSDGTSTLEDVYLVLGTDDAGEALLEDVWVDFVRQVMGSLFEGTAVTPTRLYLLYAACEGGLVSHDADGMILKTNLATMIGGISEDDTDAFSADLTSAVGFARLLWEASSIESGGFFLAYRYPDGDETRTLPGALFTDGQTAQLDMLIVTDAPSGPGAHRHHNCVVIEAGVVDPLAEKTALHVEIPDRLVKAQSIDPGFVGFQVKRGIPAADANSYTDELDALFQLLHYAAPEADHFRALPAAKPVGPVVALNDANDPLDDRWIYERVIAAFALAKAPRGEDDALPRSEDPYAGVGADRAIDVALRFQDVYGNFTVNADPPELPPLPVRYTDDVIGLNGWPSLVETYRILAEDEPRLQIDLRLQMSAYAVTPETPYAEMARRVQTGLATYKQVFYQLNQPDVNLTLATTVNPGADLPLEKSAFRGFAADAYHTLTAMHALVPLRHAVSGSAETLATVATAYHTTPLALAKDNANVYGLFPAGQTITVPLEYIVGEDDTLSTIAKKTGFTLSNVAEHPALVLLPGGELTIPNPEGEPGVHTIAEGETLAAIAAAEDTTLTALIQANRGGRGLVRPGIAIPTGSVSYTTADHDSLTGILAAMNERLGDHSGSHRLTLADVVHYADSAPLNPAMHDAEEAPVALLIGTHLSLNGTALTATRSAGSGLAALATEDRPLEDWAAANQNLIGLLKPGAAVTLGGRTITIRANETLRTLRDQANATLDAPLTLAETAAAITADAVEPGAVVIMPPARLGTAHTLTAGPDAYPTAAIFSLLVSITIARDADLIDDQFADLDSVRAATAYLAPETGSAAERGDDLISLRGFAAAFENAFPGLKLAASKDRARHSTAAADNPNPAAAKPLWAVQIGADGVDYHIDAGENALFFAPAPLSTQPITASVTLDSGEQKRFAGIDLDTWARQFLAAVDEFLAPEMVVPINERSRSIVDGILSYKRVLADAIAARLAHVLERDDITPEELERRRENAADVFRQELLATLSSAYTVETLVQLGVEVQIAERITDWPQQHPPRLFGRPVALGDAEDGDYALSAAKVPLTPADAGGATLTFLYNTTRPTEDRQAAHTLAFHPGEMEYNIEEVPGIEEYQASSWLAFILPPGGDDPRGQIGEIVIPIPLRAYPMPPSLIMQRAEADPDSWDSLLNVREWQYTFMYEHPEIAQDTITARTAFNVGGFGVGGASAGGKTLFEALAEFITAYPDIAPQLAQLAAAKPEDDVTAQEAALQRFHDLVEMVATAWGSWQTGRASLRPDDITGYSIREEDAGDPTMRALLTMHGAAGAFGPPLYRIPGYALDESATVEEQVNGARRLTLTYHALPEGAQQDTPRFGASSIPDRVLTIQNLDIIGQQNARAELWLTRNRSLADAPTNPAFIYQTPVARFNTPITPLLDNEKWWNVAAIDGGEPQQRALEDHLRALFSTLLPAKSVQPYGIRVGCRYAFALAEGTDDAGDLVAVLPVTLGMRQRIDADAELLPAIDDYVRGLANAIRAWQAYEAPVTTGGRWVLSVNLFSEVEGSNEDLPLLKIEHLYLLLTDILD